MFKSLLYYVVEMIHVYTISQHNNNNNKTSLDRKVVDTLGVPIFAGEFREFRDFCKT